MGGSFIEVVPLSDYTEKPQAGGKVRFIDNRSHSLQQFCAHVRQLLHKLPDKSAVLLIHLFFFLGVQAVNSGWM